MTDEVAVFESATDEPMEEHEGAVEWASNVSRHDHGGFEMRLDDRLVLTVVPDALLGGVRTRTEPVTWRIEAGEHRISFHGDDPEGIVFLRAGVVACSTPRIGPREDPRGDGLDETQVKCPNGHALNGGIGATDTAAREFRFIDGSVGTRNYCGECGEELVEA